MAENDIKIEFFNGGGSGNAAQCAQDTCLTEITVGSGLLQVSRKTQKLLIYRTDGLFRLSKVHSMYVQSNNQSLKL